LGPPAAGQAALDGIVLTHAHLGHLAGLLQLGREALATRALPVYAMPELRDLIASNSPFSLLIEHGHIRLEPLEDGVICGDFFVSPESVDHRNEASETVALTIRGPTRSILYLPDIDNWSTYPLAERLRAVDLAFIDATFYSRAEIGYRDPSTVPHPLVTTTMALLDGHPLRERVRFLHLNHTNPLLDPASDAAAEVRRRGFGIARQGAMYPL
jgi:pyrroloquinoline quinone biosynthesis protein B